MPGIGRHSRSRRRLVGFGSIRPAILAVCCAALALIAPPNREAAAQPPSEKLNLTAAQWRADLRFLAQELPKRHANAFHSCSKPDFDRAVADLDSRLQNLNSDESWAGLERIACLIGDAHTYIRLPADCPDLPLVIGRFGDEYRVARVAPGMEKALGAKVLAIGGTPVAKARELLRPLSPREIFENRADVVAAIDFTAGCALHAVGISQDRASASYTLQNDSGEQFTVEAKATPGPDVLRRHGQRRAVPLHDRRHARRRNDWCSPKRIFGASERHAAQLETYASLLHPPLPVRGVG